MSPSYVVRQLAQLCIDHPLQTKILLVPGVRAGNDLTTALARSGQGWTNLRVTTPILLAAEEAEPQMAVRNGRRLQPEGGRRLVEGLLAAWPDEERRYFRSAVGQAQVDRGLAPSLYATLDAMRLAGVLPEHVVNLADGEGKPGDKAADLATIYRRYGELLQAGSWWDDAATFACALTLASEHAPKDILWVVLDEVELPELAADFVECRAGGRMYRLGRRVYGVSPPQFSAAARFPRAQIPGAREDAPVAPAPERSPGKPPPKRPRRPTESVVQGDLFLDPLRDADPDQPAESLFDLGRKAPAEESVEVSPGGRLLTAGLTPEDGDRVHVHQAIGLETEVGQVLRDVFDRGLRFDDVEIAYTATVPYLSLLFDAVERWDLPADFAVGVPSVLTRPGRSLQWFLHWIAGGLDGVELAGCLQAGEIHAATSPIRPGELARWLLRGRAGAGHQETLAALERVGATAPADDELQQRLAAGRKQLEALFDCVPADGGSEDLLRGCCRFLQLAGSYSDDARSERDLRVRDGLTTCLEDLCRLPESPGSRSKQAERLLAVLQRHTSEAGRAQPGRIRVAPLRGAGYCGRGHLYVLGLDEFRFPGNAAQDPILLDDERRALSPQMGLAATSPGNNVFHLIRVLGSAPGRVTLSASCLHLADGREPSPTPLFEQARRQLQCQPIWARPAPGPSEGGADALDALLGQRGQQGLGAALDQAYPDVASGLTAVRSRAQAAPTRFAGWIAQPQTETLGLDGDRVLSSQMLETLAACPRRYLWRYSLGLVPPDEPERDPRRWLHPLEMGNLLHGLFLDFMRQVQDQQDRVGLGHESRLQELVESAIEAQRQRVPVIFKAAYRSDRRRIERAARIFLHAEAHRFAADPGLHPAAFELDFGFAPEPAVEVRLSHEIAFRLRGRIDRVDAVRDASGDTTAYEVWDYKTGSTFNFGATDLGRGGRILQWALYAYALPHLVDDESPVRLSGYFFASERGAGQRFSDAPPARHELAATLQPLFDLARQGYFPALHKGDSRGGGPCRFCDYRRVCAGEAIGSTQVTEQHEAAAQLAALVEGWAEAVSADRAGSRQSLERALADLGLRPQDVAPEEAARCARDWIAS